MAKTYAGYLGSNIVDWKKAVIFPVLKAVPGIKIILIAAIAIGCMIFFHFHHLKISLFRV
jgi:hypothetical protein